MRTFCRHLLPMALLSCCFASPPLAALEPCRLEVVDRESGWPVPLVELRTTHQSRFVSDNAGIIAFDLPELMGRETWFDVLGHGYEVPKDGFGMRGVRLTPQPGHRLRVEVQRRIIAKRIGRLTGAGLFAESQKLHDHLEWQESGVLGCDSVQNAVLDGRLHWFWGDTTLAHYPLGIFHTTGATTAIGPLTSLVPPLQMTFEHFRDDQGRPRGLAEMPGSGPTWISACAAVPDQTGTPRLVASYVKIKPPLESYEIGLCVWNPALRHFDRHRVVWNRSSGPDSPPPFPDGHAALWKDAQGKAWVLFGNPLPTLRCAATFEAWEDPARWENLQPRKTLSSPDGHEVRLHSGSIAWNSFRRRWVTVFMEAFGTPSTFGELWYAEAESPLGPWGPAVKVLTHENYTFYNPRLHPELTPEGSPVLLFEGTYTQQFAEHPVPTARHDYNQILYRLDLDDPGLRPAQTRAANPGPAVDPP